MTHYPACGRDVPFRLGAGTVPALRDPEAPGRRWRCCEAPVESHAGLVPARTDDLGRTWRTAPAGVVAWRSGVNRFANPDNRESPFRWIRQVSDNPAFASVSPIRKPARICP